MKITKTKGGVEQMCKRKSCSFCEAARMVPCEAPQAAARCAFLDQSGRQIAKALARGIEAGEIVRSPDGSYALSNEAGRLSSSD